MERSQHLLHVAVEGCCHGELDRIYAEIVAARNGPRRQQVDVLLICGDFQSVRNQADLQCVAVPPKYRSLNTFHEYVNGTKVAPVLTIFVGGNHEASNILQSLYYGGYVAPNIYYLGAAGVVRVCKAGRCVRIAGVSGIYHGPHFTLTHYESPPYSPDTLRSVYHTRELEIFRLAQLQQLAGTGMAPPVDVCLSHDWPQHIWRHGDLGYLLRCKPYFRDDVNSGRLGSPPLMFLLRALRPQYWFAAHLHVKFMALVAHDGDSGVDGDGSSSTGSGVADESVRGGKRPHPDAPPPPCPPGAAGSVVRQTAAANDSFFPLFADQTGSAELPPVLCGELPPSGSGAVAASAAGGTGDAAAPRSNPLTRFLALDKIHPQTGRGGGRGDRGGYLQFLSVPMTTAAAEGTTAGAGDDAVALCMDVPWLAILRKTHHLLASGSGAGASGAQFRAHRPMPREFPAVTTADLEWVRGRLDEQRGGSLEVPQLAPAPVPHGRDTERGNAQTDSILSLLQLPHIWTVPVGGTAQINSTSGQGSGGGSSSSSAPPAALWPTRAPPAVMFRPPPPPGPPPPPPPGPPPLGPPPLQQARAPVAAAAPDANEVDIEGEEEDTDWSNAAAAAVTDSAALASTGSAAAPLPAAADSNEISIDDL